MTSILLDGTHFNYKNKYSEDIAVYEMSEEDVNIFKKVISEINDEYDENTSMMAVYSSEYHYFYVQYSTSNIEHDIYEPEGANFENEVRTKMKKKGIIYE